MTVHADTAELAFSGLRRQTDMLANGEVSSSALVEGALARIARRQPELGAFRVVRDEGARAEADDADRRLAAGERLPLLGVPIAVKDDVDLTGESTPFGCVAGSGSSGSPIPRVLASPGFPRLIAPARPHAHAAAEPII